MVLKGVRHGYVKRLNKKFACFGPCLDVFLKVRSRSCCCFCCKFMMIYLWESFLPEIWKLGLPVGTAIALCSPFSIRLAPSGTMKTKTRSARLFKQGVLCQHQAMA